MLDIKCPEQFLDVEEFARAQGLSNEFKQTMDYLSDYGQGPTRALIFHDFAPHSLTVTMQRLDANDVWRDWWHGGIIYDKTERKWSVHT